MKKIFLILLSLFNVFIYGEVEKNVYGLDIAMSYNDELSGRESLKGGMFSAGLSYELENTFNDKWSITYGPKISGNIGIEKVTLKSVIYEYLFCNEETDLEKRASYLYGNYLDLSLNLTGLVDLNYNINDKVKSFIGIEAGMGFEILKNIDPEDVKSDLKNQRINVETKISFRPIIKGKTGIKIYDKYNLGIFVGYANKFMIGLEAGYRF